MPRKLLWVAVRYTCHPTPPGVHAAGVRTPPGAYTPCSSLVPGLLRLLVFGCLRFP